MLKHIVLATAFALGSATAASALTVSNKSDAEIQVGLDMGDKETVHKIAAGKSLTFKNECNQHCGVTGPWNYSWWAKTGDTIETDGRCLTCAK